MAEQHEYSLGELAKLLDVEAAGDPAVVLHGLATLKNAGPGQLSFFHNSRYIRDLARTAASAVILHPDHLARCPTNALLSPRPYITYARASRLFERRHETPGGIHPSSIIHPEASIDAGAEIGPHCVIEEGVVIAARVSIGPGCVIRRDCRIGEDSQLHANITLYPDVHIGRRAIVHASVVLGGDGFGFAFDGSEYLKIAQLGGVRIGDDVEIGAGSSIDRGALDHTLIGDGVKIDNQVQIAHNVTVGAHTVICGCSAIAGSSRIGKNCTIAGGVGIINHLAIADGVTITAMSLVNKSIDKAGVYSSGTGLSDSSSWRRNMLRFRELDEMSRRLRRLERALESGRAREENEE